jgi:hypothetical protein
MPRTDKSVAFLTGMIVAALSVILLISFSRETYVVRDGYPSIVRAAAAACADTSRQACALDRPICAPLLQAAGEPICVVPKWMLHQLIAQQLKSLALEGEAAEAGGDDDD